MSEHYQPTHTFDEEGEHDEECYACLLDEEVKSECDCGKCCHLLIEVLLEDAEREPRIAEKCDPIFAPPEMTASGTRELIGYLLNSAENEHACTFLDRATNRCTIYESRPLTCRLFSCDGEGREQLIELGILERTGRDDR